MPQTSADSLPLLLILFLLFLRVQIQDSVDIVLRRLVVLHLLSRLAILCIQSLFQRQQFTIFCIQLLHFWNLIHLLEGILRSFMNCDFFTIISWISSSMSKLFSDRFTFRCFDATSSPLMILRRSSSRYPSPREESLGDVWAFLVTFGRQDITPYANVTIRKDIYIISLMLFSNSLMLNGHQSSSKVRMRFFPTKIPFLLYSSILRRFFFRYFSSSILPRCS